MPRRALSFSIAFLAPASLLLGHSLGGGFYFATPVFLLGVLPLLDLLLGTDPSTRRCGIFPKARSSRRATRE